SDLIPGEKEFVPFPSGEYEFLHNTRDLTGGYKACSLFSPMGDFNTQAQAVAVADAVMLALFDEANRAETEAPTRHRVISGGMASSRRKEG
ncbi:MAG: [NiFe]-hydrogenase assembly chaperone HybE, partial [Alphaproteobacteria bacterium]|nr:[NiFe]-hydrogenase assembly chaperone HybE [Alphaproteobacteria bacterium]